MGLLDSLLTSVIGGGIQGQSPLLQAALQLIQRNGGLTGIISKFEHGGMVEQVGSWVGTGANLPITPSQLQEILGTGTIGEIAQQLGLSHGDASSGLAQVLPQIIDKLTPTGQVTTGHDDELKQALAALAKRG